MLDASSRILSALETRRSEFRANPTALRGFIDGELSRGFDRDYAARLVLGVHGRGASDADVKLFGQALTERLRAWEASEHRPHTPVVALTAHILSEHKERARLVGMDGHMAKPVELSQLRELIAYWVGERDRRRQGDALPS